MKSIRTGQVSVLGGQLGQGLVDVDSESRGLVEISAVHRWVHRGYMRQAWNYSSALASSAAIELLIITGSWATHTRFSASAGGDALLGLFEGSVASSNGTPITPVNRNRNSALAARSTVFKDPTISSTGLQLDSTLLPGGAHGQTGGGGGASFEEFILAPLTKYLFRLTNIANGTEPAEIKILFYEPAF